MYDFQDLLRALKAHYKKEGRSHLPWRGTRDPYHVLVSEVMLQQTQVDRVLPKYKEFLRAFPTSRALAKASLSQVLFHWNGLGYNRRAKFLQEAARVVTYDYKGVLPKDVAHLEKLPGVGHYTARAVAAFAYNQPEVFVETNIRTVFLHHLFSPGTTQQGESFLKVPDAALLPLVAQALQKSNMQPRDFYAALMDYGSRLKRSGLRLNSKSAHYAKQSKFKGSTRELRGTILRELLKSPATPLTLQKKSNSTLPEIERELVRLHKEGLLTKKGSRFAVAQ